MSAGSSRRVASIERTVPSVSSSTLSNTSTGPALDGDRQDQPTRQIAQVVRCHPEEQRTSGA